jgi:DNA helicase-2/ATP-dependent DNA helicase PcrA
LEFPVVFLVGCEDGLLPLRWSSSDEADTAEERRLFFVGMTRAKNRLFLSHAKKRLWRGKVREMNTSPFLQQIQEELLERVQRSTRRKAKRTAEDQLRLF